MSNASIASFVSGVLEAVFPHASPPPSAPPSPPHMRLREAILHDVYRWFAHPSPPPPPPPPPLPPLLPPLPPHRSFQDLTAEVMHDLWRATHPKHDPPPPPPPPPMEPPSFPVPEWVVEIQKQSWWASHAVLIAAVAGSTLILACGIEWLVYKRLAMRRSMM